MALSYKLPEIDASPYVMRSIDPITVVIHVDLKPYLTFDPALNTLIWIDDHSARSLAERKDLLVEITLWNEQGDSSFFSTLLVVQKTNRAPTFVDFDANKVHEVRQKESIEISLPET